MKRLNQRGPRVLGRLPQPVEIDEIGLREAIRIATPLIDTRPAAAFASGHLRGALSVPLGKSFTTWSGWMIDGEREVVLIAADARAAEAAARALAMIGIDRVASYATPETMRQAAGSAGLQTVERLSPNDLRARMQRGDVQVVDVRDAAEWNAGHLPGAQHIPLAQLAERAGELPRDRAIVVQCQGGLRSMIGSSVLQARGVARVLDLDGGFAEWTASGLPTERGGRLSSVDVPA
jgi:hydroxyacylglutathione hydrolase